jgi:hypothetical protein
MIHKFVFRGALWRYRVIPEDKFNKLYGETTVAQTDTGLRVVTFKDTTFNKKVAIHEIFHAICASTYSQSAEGAGMTMSAYEELIAELLENHLEEYVLLCRKVHRTIKKEMSK